jgi:hypothetical protein
MFFLHNREGSRRPQDFHFINIGRYNICSKVLAFIALDHQLIGKRTLQLFTNTPELQKSTQSTPWVSPPMTAGVLQALPPRNKSK